MSNQISTTLILCIIFGLFSFYYFNKFQDSEKEYVMLHKKFDEMYIENQKMKSRIKDLQSYKNDVSKTMKILDNELILINNHIQKQNLQSNVENQNQNSNNLGNSTNMFNFDNTDNVNREQTISRPSYIRRNYNNVSLLSPELLHSLFNNMNQENYNGMTRPETNQDHSNSMENENENVNENKNEAECPPNADDLQNDQGINETENLLQGNLQPNQRIINVNYDITYSGSNNYDRYLINDN